MGWGRGFPSLFSLFFFSVSSFANEASLAPHCREILLKTAALERDIEGLGDETLWTQSGAALQSYFAKAHPNEERVRFYPGAGRVLDKEYSKPYLRLVNQGVMAPRGLGNLIEEGADWLQRETNQLENDLADLSTRQGEKFLPESQRLVLDVMQKIVNASRVKAGASYLLKPILLFINDTIRRFLRLLSVSFRVDRDQAELFTIFMQLVKEDAISLEQPEFKKVRDDLSVNVFRSGTYGIAPSTYQTLALWSRDPSQARFVDYLNGRQRLSQRLQLLPSESRPNQERLAQLRHQLREILTRLKTSEEKLEAERRAFGIRHFAYLMLSDFLRQTVQSDGQPAVELTSLMVAVVQQSLEDFPSLRDFFLSLFSAEGIVSFLHPRTNREVHLEGGLVQGLEQFGGSEMDPFLVQQILSPERLQLEYFRALSLTLAYEKNEMKRRHVAWRALHFARREERYWNKIGQATFQSALRSGAAIGLPSAAIEQIWQMLFETDAKPTHLASGPKREILALVPTEVAHYFETLLSGDEGTEARKYLAKIIKSAPVVETPSGNSPLVFSSAQASNFLKLYFRGLSQHAARIFEADIELQNKTFEEGKRDVPLSEIFPLETSRRQVLERVWKAFHALRECLIHHGNANQGITAQTAHEIAREIAIRYLEENPSLERLVINTPYPKLNEMSGELVLRALRARFGVKRSLVDPETDELLNSPQRIQEAAARSNKRAWKLCLATGFVVFITSTAGNYFKDNIAKAFRSALSNAGVLAPAAQPAIRQPTPVRTIPISSGLGKDKRG